MPGAGAGHDSERTSDVSPYTQTRAALKVAVRRRGDSNTLTKALPPGEEAHRASGLAPPEASAAENPIESFGLGGTFDLPAAGHTQRFYTLRNAVTGAEQVRRGEL